MTKITKERVQQKIKKLEFAISQSAFTSIRDGLEEELEMARMLLAGMEQEPVAGEAKFKNDEQHWSPCTAAHVSMVLANQSDWPNYEVRYLYAAPQLTDAERELETVKAQLKAAQAHITELEAAPPAPVGPGEEPVPVMPDFPGRVMTQRECYRAGWEARDALSKPATAQQIDNSVHTLSTELMRRIDKATDGRHSVATLSTLRKSVVEACRTAMLQSLCGIQTAPVLDSLPRNDESLTGNSPVIPDGWVKCSVRNPEESGRYWCYVEEQNDLGKSHYQWNCSWNGDGWWIESENGGRVTHWQPLAEAPKQ